MALEKLIRRAVSLGAPRFVFGLAIFLWLARPIGPGIADGADVLCRGSKPVWPPIANGRRAHPSSQDAARDCGHRALAARSPQERARTGTAVIKLMVALALSYLDIR